MAEYIEREAVLDLCNTEYQNRLQMFDYCGDTVAWNIGSEIKALPAADVAPVVHGRWIEREDPMLDTYYTCSACNEDFYIEQTGDPVKDLFTYTYCPNCGAKMDLEENKWDRNQ